MERREREGDRRKEGGEEGSRQPLRGILGSLGFAQKRRKRPVH